MATVSFILVIIVFEPTSNNIEVSTKVDTHT